MKRILSILLIIVVFVSCDNGIRTIGGLYHYKETGIFVEIVNDGYGNPSIKKVGDIKGLYNTKKRNSLINELDLALKNAINNGEFYDVFTTVTVDDIKINWYFGDETEDIENIIGEHGAYIQFDKYDFFEVNDGRIIHQCTKKYNSEVCNIDVFIAFIEKVDDGDYFDLKAKKLFYYDNDNFYEIEPVINRNFYDEEWKLVDTENFNIIDMINNDDFKDENSQLEGFIYQPNVVAKELEFF